MAQSKIRNADINAAAAIDLSKLATSTSAQLAAILSDETGTGSAVFGTSPSISTPLITGRTSGVAYSAGQIGEVLTNNGGATSLVTATGKNVASISLTAGSWLVGGGVGFIAANTTTTTLLIGGISTTTNTLPAYNGSVARLQVTFPTTGYEQTLALGTFPVDISATTTYYNVAFAQFGTSTMQGYGFIWAKRIG